MAESVPEVLLEARDVVYRYPGGPVVAAVNDRNMDDDAVNGADRPQPSGRHRTIPLPFTAGTASSPGMPLDGASLIVRRGEFVLLTGPSGCGKSTLLRAFLGLVPHLHGGGLSGEVRAFGEDVAETLPHRLAPRIGMVFQNPEDQLVATAVEADVAFGPENLGLPRVEVAARVERAIARIGIEALRHRSVHEISVGQQQKVALASVMALEPEVLLLDEPTSCLDPRSARDLLEEVRKLNRESGLTVVLAEHRLDLALPFADRLVVMHRGRVIRDGSPRAVVALGGLAEIGVGLPPVVEAFRRMGVSDPPLSVEEAAGRLGDEPRRAVPAPMNLAEMGRCSPRPEGRGHCSELDTEGRCASAPLTAPASRPLPLTAGTAPNLFGSAHHPEDGNARPAPNSALDHPLAIVRDLRHVYPDGREALRGVDLAIRAGEVVALLGESGAGKSTLARHLIGLLRPTSGGVRVGGRDAARESVARLAETVGYVVQNPLHQLFAETVAAEIAFGPLARGWKREAANARVDELLASFGLERYRDRHPLALSEGERRRVALAATLAARPRLLVLDEPTVGQDAGERKRLGALLREFASEGCSALVITHDVEFAAASCDRAVVLVDGRVLADGPVAEILGQSDLLERAALEAPQLVRLAALSERGRGDLSAFGLWAEAPEREARPEGQPVDGLRPALAVTGLQPGDRDSAGPSEPAPKPTDRPAISLGAAESRFGAGDGS